MSDLDFTAVHTVHDCASGQATHTPLTLAEIAEQADIAAKHTDEQQAAAEHRATLLAAVHASDDPAVSALVELLGVA